MSSTKVFIALTLIVSALIAAILYTSKDKEISVGGSGFFEQVTATNLLGTSSTPFGLSANLAPNPGRVLAVKGCDKVVIGGAYLPRETNAYTTVLVEGSIDEGVTYLPLPTRVAGTTEIDVYADGGLGMGAASSGIPFVFPGDKTTVAGRGVTSTIAEFEQLAFTHLRVSARENFTASTGTLWLQTACAR